MHQIHVVVMLPQKQFCLDTRFKTWDKHLSKYVYKKRSINRAPERQTGFLDAFEFSKYLRNERLPTNFKIESSFVIRHTLV